MSNTHCRERLHETLQVLGNVGYQKVSTTYLEGGHNRHLPVSGLLTLHLPVSSL